MIIETKFNIGDTVWIMCDNKPYCATVTMIMTKHLCPEDSEEIKKAVKYGLGWSILTKSSRMEFIGESKLFSTKEELINSL